MFQNVMKKIVPLQYVKAEQHIMNKLNQEWKKISTVKTIKHH